MKIPQFPLSFRPNDLEPYGTQYVQAARTYNMLRTVWEDLRRNGSLDVHYGDFVEAIKLTAPKEWIVEIALIDNRFSDVVVSLPNCSCNQSEGLHIDIQIVDETTPDEFMRLLLMKHDAPSKLPNGTLCSDIWRDLCNRFDGKTAYL